MMLRSLRAAAMSSLFVLACTPVTATSQIPAVPVTEPGLSVTKDHVTGEVVLAWSSTESPYSVLRSTAANFSGPTAPAVIAEPGGVTSHRDAVLNDGASYFYLVDDGRAAPRAFSLSTTAALPGESVTLDGAGFLDGRADGVTEVLLGGVSCSVTSSTTTRVTFNIPTDATTGYVLVRTGNGLSRGRLFYVVATSGLANISSVGVDSNHVPFVSDTGTAGTSDKVYKFDSLGSRTQVGALNEATGLGTDSASPRNHVYYGNGLTQTANAGSIRRTDSSGADAPYAPRCADSSSDSCYVYAIGVDPGLTDYGPDGRVYVADGAGIHPRVRIVPPSDPPVTFATGFSFGSGPRGIVVDRNADSPYNHHVFVSDSNSVRRFNSTGALQKRYYSANSPLMSPAQMALTSETRGPTAMERLVIADRNANRVILIDPATDRSKVLGIPLTSPRAVAVDHLVSSGRPFLYVGEQTRVTKLPLHKTVTVSAWVNQGVVTDDAVRDLIRLANDTFEKCGYEFQLRGNVVNHISDPASSVIVPNEGCLAMPTQSELGLVTTYRSADDRDLNVYFVAHIDDALTIGETLTSDCPLGVDDATNSGVIFDASKLSTNNFSSYRTAVPHEFVHALMIRSSWNSCAGGDEHLTTGCIAYTCPNLMSPHAEPCAAVLYDDQCAEINEDGARFAAGDP